jgi:hypothetical protein
MDTDFTVYLANMNDEQLGLFWIVASPRAKAWIQGELVRRAAARGEAPVAATAENTASERKVVAAA